MYGLGGPGIEPRWGVEIFGPGAHPASYTMGTGSFPEVKRPRRGVDHPPPYSAKVKERVELYVYSPSEPSWPVLGGCLYTYLYDFFTCQFFFGRQRVAYLSMAILFR